MKFVLSLEKVPTKCGVVTQKRAEMLRKYGFVQKII
jgi:hypothetical protein